MADTKSGKQLERFVYDFFISNKFREISYADYIKNNDTERTIIKHIPYISIYGSKCRTEFLICFDDRKIRIECKWQSVSGSVDEKFPYLLQNAAEVWEEDEVIIILDGGGYKPKAFEWIRTAANNKKYLDPNSKKIIKVFTIEDFVNWVGYGMKHLSIM